MWKLVKGNVKNYYLYAISVVCTCYAKFIVNLKIILIILYYSTYLRSFMLEMKAWKSLEAYTQLKYGRISNVAVFVKKVGGLCEDRRVLEESGEQQQGIEGVVTGGGDDNEMGTVTEGEGQQIYTQYQCQPQQLGVCMCIMY